MLLDIVFTINDWSCVVIKNFEEDFVYRENTYSPRHTGSHRLHGIFIAYGKGIKHGIKIDNIYVYDVTSTILHVFGLPIPNDVDGRVLREIFKPESEIARRKPIYADPYYYDKLRERMRLKSKIKDLNAEEESVSYKKVKYVNSC